MNGICWYKPVLNTGASQGFVLSPLLFYIDTNARIIYSSNASLFKCADHMALVDLFLVTGIQRSSSARSSYCRNGVRQENRK